MNKDTTSHDNGHLQGPASFLRAGMIGLDTSHVIGFTQLFNDPNPSEEVAGVRIVAGYPGGTDIPASRDRVGRFTEQLREMGVEIVESIPSLLEKVDVVLLESVDGRIHLEQVKPVVEVGKPVFIDKPVAGSLADAVEIFNLAAKCNVPCFSSSSIRFLPRIQELRNSDAVGEVLGCMTWGPCWLDKVVPDLFWYGIHGIEALFVIMGTGCESVGRVQTEDTELVTGVWKDGRVGTYRGLRTGKTDFGAIAFGTTGIVHASETSVYEPIAKQIAMFFKNGDPPVHPEETLEIFAFMEAADESKRRGGAQVSLESVLTAASAQTGS